MKILQNISFTLLGLLLTLGLLEGSFRILAAGPLPEIWSDRPEAYYKPATARSMQDYNYPLEKPANTYRVMVLGDSFSFAPFMQFDDAFPKRLERMLNLADQNKRAEVFNLGVPGFSTSHELHVARESLEYSPDLFLLQITLNDPQMKPYQPTGLQGENEFGSYSPQGAAKTLFNYSALGRFVLSRLHNTQTHRNYREYYFNLFERKKNWRYFSQNIKKIARLGRKHDIPVAAVIFPLFGLPLDENYPFHPLHDKVAELLKESSVPYLDLFETYQGIPLERLQVIPKVDFHPNEIGHRMAAEALYDWLADAKLLPEQILIPARYQKRIDIRVMESNRVGPLARDASYG